MQRAILRQRWLNLSDRAIDGTTSRFTRTINNFGFTRKLNWCFEYSKPLMENKFRTMLQPKSWKPRKRSSDEGGCFEIWGTELCCNYVQDNPTRYEIIMYSYVIQHMKQILETPFVSKPLVRVTKWYLRQCQIYLLDFQLKNKVLGLGLWKT